MQTTSPSIKTICASIMEAACAGRVLDVESLAVSNNIDINECLFVREELEVKSEDGGERVIWGPAKKKETRPLLHAWLFNCFRSSDPGCLAFINHCALNIKARYEMIKMMVQRLSARPYVMIIDAAMTLMGQ